ncbi:uncharacterized protein SCODWIG_02861 [Saccharomycodes ludwigii]|uniref:Uncharacterized protein n=2 Tax=Saccharomycodes ludwigii TaxID=36035 RepID=A0A376BAF0_9ASCO|nr:uncharacterized protein SCODWIG_02861 [Saccharomycodes ludwigii]
MSYIRKIKKRQTIKDLKFKNVFQYYYYIQSKKLKIQTKSFQLFIRKEWSESSDCKKTLYTLLFFKECKIDYHLLNYNEFGKLVGWNTPINSAYILFRSNFKEYYFSDNYNNRIGNKPKKYTIKINSLADLNHASTSIKYIKKLPPSLSRNEHYLNSTTAYFTQYKKMCQECQSIWKNQVSEEQKRILWKRVKELKLGFSNKVEKEIKNLDELDTLL